MFQRLILTGIVCGCCLWASSAAMAQSRVTYQATGMNSGYQGYQQPTISPYLNLGVNSNGLSNYQTLVRPMMEEREALDRQNANLQLLRQQMQSNGGMMDQRDPRVRAQMQRQQLNSRYLNYSHYFSGPRPQ